MVEETRSGDVERPGDVQTGLATGPRPRVAAVLAYLFGWVSGLILFMYEDRNEEVRFHAAQSILFSLAAFGALVALFLVSLLPFGGLVLDVLMLLVILGAVGAWLFLLYKAWRLEHVTLPYVGEIAERWARTGVG
jgi:uncharacterized membrane protein